MSDDNTQRILAALERLEIKHDQTSAGIGKMRADMETMRADVDKMRADIDKMRADVDRMRAATDKMRGDIMARIDRLQNTVDETRDAVVVNFGNTDRVERLARTAMEDSRATSEILRVMQRQIMRLQADVEQLKGAA